MTKLECVCEPDLRSFVLGELPSRVERLVAAHLTGCPACETMVRHLDKATDPVIRGLRRACGGNSSTGNADAARTIAPAASTESAAPPAGYEYLRELGRGGMGVVYLARQRHPHRLVALKVMLAGAHAGAAGKARLLAEANALAQLRHPNIVQIYEVGETGGLPYLALEYVEGGTLAAKLRGEPQQPRAAAAMVATLARAVQLAHQSGIILRDLKPANVLLQKDESGRMKDEPERSRSDSSFILHPSSLAVKIADFGLAKNAGPELTATGEFLGTPSYMAPEQATGGEVGPAADVWALGAILYECLTGRPPFRGSSPIETLEHVRTQEVVPPEQLRPGIPRDLSTVCLKCLEKDTRRRYASAEALADDIDRVLSDRPPLARRSTQIEHAWRWCRRNPTTAALVLSLFVALGSGLAGVLWQWARADDLARKNGLERDKAVKNYERARAAVEQLAKLGKELANRPGLDKTRQAIAEEVLNNCLGFLTDSSADPAVRFETAEAWQQVGRLRHHFGKFASAADAYQRSMTLLDGLLQEQPSHSGYRNSRAYCLLWIGHVVRNLPDLPGSIAAYRESSDVYCELARDFPDIPKYSLRLATCLVNWAGIIRTGPVADAEALLTQALEIHRLAVNKLPNDMIRIQDFVVCLDEYTLHLMRVKRPEEAEILCRESLVQCHRLVDEFPGNQDNWAYLSRNDRRLSEILQRSGRLADAENACRDCLKSVEYLNANYPGVFNHRLDAFATEIQLAELSNQQKKPTEAVDHWRRSLQIAVRMEADFPEEKGGKARIGKVHFDIGAAMIDLGRTAEAITELRAALNDMAPPAAAQNALARLLAIGTENSLLNPPEAVTLAEAATVSAPRIGDFWTTLGAAHLAVGDAHAALEDLEKAAAIHRDGTVDDWLLLALTHAKLDNPVEARAQFDKAKKRLASISVLQPFTHQLLGQAELTFGG